MGKTISQLRKEITVQRKRIAKEQTLAEKLSEKQKLNKELFMLKNRNLLGAGAKAKRLSAKFGKRILNVGKKAVPLVQKQARLIRDQQLRDDALTRARTKRIPKSSKKNKKKSNINKQNDLGMFSNLDF